MEKDAKIVIGAIVILLALVFIFNSGITGAVTKTVNWGACGKGLPPECMAHKNDKGYKERVEHCKLSGSSNVDTDCKKMCIDFVSELIDYADTYCNRKCMTTIGKTDVKYACSYNVECLSNADCKSKLCDLKTSTCMAKPLFIVPNKISLSSCKVTAKVKERSELRTREDNCIKVIDNDESTMWWNDEKLKNVYMTINFPLSDISTIYIKPYAYVNAANLKYKDITKSLGNLKADEWHTFKLPITTSLDSIELSWNAGEHSSGVYEVIISK